MILLSVFCVTLLRVLRCNFHVLHLKTEAAVLIKQSFYIKKDSTVYSTYYNKYDIIIQTTKPIV